MAFHPQNKQQKDVPPPTWKQVVSFLEKNTFQEKTLTPFVKPNLSVIPQTILEDVWSIVPVDPVSPLSCILYLHNAEYANMLVTARTKFLRDECTSLQENAETHLKGRAWPVRRTAEGIVACAFEQSPKEWSKLGLTAIAELYECQLVFFDIEKKECTFIPEDVRNWKFDRPCYMIQHDARAVWNSPTGFTNKNTLSWIEDKEKEGWTFSWPSAQGNMTELHALCQTLGITVQGKMKKDDLALLIGKAQCKKLFGDWISKINVVE